MAFGRNFFLVLGLMLAASSSAFAVTGGDFEFHGYLRSGARGTNSDSPRCYKNVGPAQGINEFRLGNECEDYSEMNFVANHLKPQKEGDPFFKTNITLNFGPKGWTHGEALNAGLVEAYFDGGNFFDTHVKYWVGKRFYRDAAVHMNDDFYFANTNGNGAGIYDIEMPSGKLAIAYLLQQYAGAADPITGNVGTTQKANYADFRWFDITLNEANKFDLWFNYGNNRGGNQVMGFAGTTPTTQSSDPTNGYAAGLKHKFLIADGSNTLSVQYGSKLLQGLDLSTPAEISNQTAVNNSNRLRFVEDLVIQPLTNLGLEFAGKWERFNANGSNNSGRWWNLGTRPVYSFNEHFAMVVEAGISSVKYDTDTDAHLLKRLTFAPTLRLNPKYYARPEMRVFYTTSFNEGSAYGVQGEVWF